MRCYFLVLAKDWAHDAETQNISIFHMVEEIQLALDQPIIVPDLCVVSGWEREDEELPGRYEVEYTVRRLGHSEPAVTMSLEISLEGPRYRTRAYGLPLTGTGAFRIEARSRAAGSEQWKTSDQSWPLNVTLGAPTAPSSVSAVE
jgi:Tfp pilus assembly protein PilX